MRRLEDNLKISIEAPKQEPLMEPFETYPLRQSLKRGKTIIIPSLGIEISYNTKKYE